VAIGNSSADDLTITASLASTISIKTTRTYNIGSADLGLATVYFGGNSTYTAAVSAPSSGLVADTVFTFPNTSGSAGNTLVNDGTGVTNWHVMDSPDTRINYTLAGSVGSSNLTIALKDKAGNDASAASPVRLTFRNATLATGDYTTANVTAALSIVIPSGATMGFTNAVEKYIYVYAMNNAGTVELVATCTPLNEGLLATTTIIDTSSDSATVPYSTTARSNLAVKYLGRILSTQATAGTWATAPAEIATVPNLLPYYNETTLALSNDFSAGSIKVVRVGSLVTVTLIVSATFSSSVGPSTAASFVPAWARPAIGQYTACASSSSIYAEIWVEATGQFGYVFRNWAGTGTAQTSVGTGTISYCV